jgi:hypothetical protein
MTSRISLLSELTMLLLSNSILIANSETKTSKATFKETLMNSLPTNLGNFFFMNNQPVTMSIYDKHQVDLISESGGKGTLALSRGEEDRNWIQESCLT